MLLCDGVPPLPVFPPLTPPSWTAAAPGAAGEHPKLFVIHLRPSISSSDSAHPVKVTRKAQPVALDGNL